MIVYIVILCYAVQLQRAEDYKVYRTPLYHIVSHRIVLYCIISYRIPLSCIVPDCIDRILFYLRVSNRIVSYPIVSYRTISYLKLHPFSLILLNSSPKLRLKTKFWQSIAAAATSPSETRDQFFHDSGFPTP